MFLKPNKLDSIRLLRIIVLIAVLLFTLNKLQAQSDDFRVWIDLSAYREIKSATIAINGEFYTKDNSQIIERTSVGVDGSYSINSFLTLDSGYLLMNYFRTDYRKIRNRFYSTATFKWQISNFVFSHRERIQLTRKSLPGANASSDLYWRNRFRAEFKKATWKVIPSATIESFYSWGRQGTNSFDEFRYSLAAKYNLTRNQGIRLYGLLSDSFDSDFYVFGLEYEISL